MAYVLHFIISRQLADVWVNFITHNNEPFHYYIYKPMKSSVNNTLLFRRYLHQHDRILWDELYCILSPVAKLRNATITFVMSVCLSAWNNSAPTGRIAIKFGIWGLLENLSRKFKFP
jgi:hypothetical protein